VPLNATSASRLNVICAIAHSAMTPAAGGAAGIPSARFYGSSSGSNVAWAERLTRLRVVQPTATASSSTSEARTPPPSTTGCWREFPRQEAAFAFADSSAEPLRVFVVEQPPNGSTFFDVFLIVISIHPSRLRRRLQHGRSSRRPMMTFGCGIKRCPLSSAISTSSSETAHRAISMSTSNSFAPRIRCWPIAIQYAVRVQKSAVGAAASRRRQ
jgi:hypothetical protein